MIKGELCFVCVPFISECNMRHKEPSSGVDYSVLNMMVCNGVEQAGFVPVSPTHLWSYCFKEIYGRYNKERIIQAGFRLIKSCDCFYFCDCEYDEDMHIEMKLWHDRAIALKKELITIDRKFLDKFQNLTQGANSAQTAQLAQL